MGRDGRFWRVVKTSQRRWDRLTVEVKRRVTGFGDLALVAYRGHGGHGRIRVVGRLVEEKEVADPGDETSLLKTVVSAIRRFESDEIPDARLVARFGDTAMAEGVTDQEGYFRLTLDVGDDGPEPGWQQVEIELVREAMVEEQRPE